MRGHEFYEVTEKSWKEEGEKKRGQEPGEEWSCEWGKAEAACRVHRSPAEGEPAAVRALLQSPPQGHRRPGELVPLRATTSCG